MAFETARLLMKLNHRVELAMIDSPRVVGGQVLRTPGADGRGNAGAEADPAAALTTYRFDRPCRNSTGDLKPTRAGSRHILRPRFRCACSFSPPNMTAGTGFG